MKNWKTVVAMPQPDKEEFYRLAAKRFAASTLIYHVDSLVHVEDVDDIWFWRQMLSLFRPGKYKFLRGSMNEKSRFTTGCEQCLKYKQWLSQRFFVCIDSDLRYILDENLTAQQGILQTYTYSWENHCCFAEKLNAQFATISGRTQQFDFEAFLTEYSLILYPAFVRMIYCERTNNSLFDKKQFRKLIVGQFRKGDEIENGKIFLENLAKEVDSVLNSLHLTNFDFTAESARLNEKGVEPSNLYLYLRGHNIFSLIKSIGDSLCAGSNFATTVLKANVVWVLNPVVDLISKDIAILNTIRKTV